MNNQDYKELPQWSDCELAVDEKRATALEEFIYEYEPGDYQESTEWRRRLLALVRWSKKLASNSTSRWET